MSPNVPIANCADRRLPSLNSDLSMRSPSPTAATAKTKEHYPYFTPDEVSYLSEKQRGKISETQEERLRQQACAFIEAIGSKMGL